MTTAAGWTGLIATLATLCAGVCGVGEDCQSAESARNAVVIAIGTTNTWTEPLTIDCDQDAEGDPSLRAVLRYQDGSRHARRWSSARVPARAGLHVGDHVRFDPASCALFPASE